MTPNAFVFDPNGMLINSFYAGDGIEAAILDKSGDIWIGYFVKEFLVHSDTQAHHGITPVIVLAPTDS